jgi:hypothetical protein
MVKLWGIAGAVIVALGLAGCERDEAIFITRVHPSDLLPDGVSGDAVSASVEKALKQRGFILSQGSTRNYVAKVEVRRDAGSSSPDKWSMRVVLVPRDSTDEIGVPMEGEGEADADEAVPRAEQLDIAASAAAKELQDERKLMRKQKNSLAQTLSSDSRRLRDFSIRLAGARRMKDLVPALSARLQEEPEPELILRIVGALVQIGDSRAVSPLVELTKRKHPIFINQIVFAVAQIGGQEAEAYLDTMAQGHPSEQVRHAAREALDELLSKKSVKRSATR